MSPLPYLSLYRVSGADAAGFLQAQLAADVAPLAVGDACYSAWCSARGQVIGLMLVHRQEGGWLLAGESRLMDAMMQRLRRYVLRARVEITAAPGRLSGLPADMPPPAGATVLEPFPKSGHEPGTGLRYALAGPGDAADVEPADWRWQELRHGVLWLEPATSERFVPQMLGLDRLGAVSFNKGCYPGQEVIARARYLGRIKRRPVWLECSMAPQLQVGAECALRCNGASVEGIIADRVRRQDGATLAVVVAALAPDARVESIVIDGSNIPAVRLAPL